MKVSELLQNYGVKKETAKTLENNISGVDLINLVNALNGNILAKNILNANKILSKYGVSISESNDDLMNMYLETKKDDLNIISEYLRPMSECSDRLSQILINEGYNFYVDIKNNDPSNLLDLLTDNNIDFLSDNNGLIQIKCFDREKLYQISQLVGKIMKTTLNDSTKRNINMDKKQMGDKPKIRNKSLIALRQRTGSGIHTSDNKKNDDFSRKSKHKLDPKKEPFESIDHTTQLSEQVLGMTRIEPLHRLKELAGMKNDHSYPETNNTIDNSYDLDNSILDTPSYSEVDAFLQIDENLKSIQQLLGNIKLNEYKLLLSKLEDLTNQVRNMGRDYLG